MYHITVLPSEQKGDFSPPEDFSVINVPLIKVLLQADVPHCRRHQRPSDLMVARSAFAGKTIEEAAASPYALLRVSILPFLM